MTNITSIIWKYIYKNNVDQPFLVTYLYITDINNNKPFIHVKALKYV